MRRFCLSLVLLLILGGVAACSSDPYDRAYTASGEGLQEADLSEDGQFNSTDDLNVVVKLNRRDESVTVTARFIDPNGEIMDEIEAEADSEVGTVVLGIDYEGRADQINEWIRGRYQVEILIDSEKRDTLYFRVN